LRLRHADRCAGAERGCCGKRSAAEQDVAPVERAILRFAVGLVSIAPVSEGYQGYLNLKAYKDFAAENRPEGYAAWVTLAISPAAPTDARAKAPLIRK
jgi:hypothetical protein